LAHDFVHFQPFGGAIDRNDTNLYAFDPTTITSSVNRLKTNLIGDGWRIVGPYYVPRHDDTYDPVHTNLVNRLAQSNILQTLRTEWAANTNDRPKGAILLGHVTIPYSGTSGADGHGNHAGAWPADMLYGEMDAGIWDIPANDTGAITNGLAFWANWNLPNDGKYWVSSTHDLGEDLELFVGRIDFANLPSFGTTTAASAPEVNLISQYMTKNENYRKKLPPFPVAGQGAALSALARLPAGTRGERCWLTRRIPAD
jgi:hypothetical protein